MKLEFNNMDELIAFYDKHVAGKRRSGKKSSLSKRKTTAKKGVKKPLAKKAVKKKTGPSLSDKIRTVIQEFIQKSKSFTANDVYDVMVKKDATVKKQSVVTAVLKQMKTKEFAKIKMKETAGNGPRKVKLFVP